MSTKFSEIRLCAANALDVGRSVELGEIECRWQDASPFEIHVGLYCNLVQHGQALESLLTRGTWCDEVPVPDTWTRDDGEGVSDLIGFYSLAPAVHEMAVAG